MDETIADANTPSNGARQPDAEDLLHLAEALQDAGTARLEADERTAVQAEVKDELESTLPQALHPGARLLDHDFPPLEFAITPYMPKGEFTELVGAHGIFKSTIALYGCLSVATGRDWGDKPVVKGRSAFISLEDTERTISERVKAWLERVSAEDRATVEADIRSNFGYLARDQAQSLVLTRVEHGRTLPANDVIDHVGKLVLGVTGGDLGTTKTRSTPIDLVVLETASRLHAGEEKNESLLVFAQALERIARTGAAAVVIRHVSKEAARKGRTDSYVGRGGGSAADAARSVLALTRVTKEGKDEDADPFAPVRLVHAKSTHTRPGSDVSWRPIETEHGVFLQSVSEAQRAGQDADLLYEALVAAGDKGLTRTEIHAKRPVGLSRPRASAAMRVLLQDGRASQTEEVRGRTRQPAVVYRVSAPPLEAKDAQPLDGSSSPDQEGECLE